jgi:hypothetical protein
VLFAFLGKESSKTPQTNIAFWGVLSERSSKILQKAFYKKFLSKMLQKTDKKPTKQRKGL